LIIESYGKFAKSNGIFEVPRACRPGQIIIYAPKFTMQLANVSNDTASPDP
jgi:hypothetical protein